MSTKVTTVRLPEDMAQQLDLVARVDGHSVTAIINAAIQRYLNERTVTTEFRAAAAALIGRERALAEGLRSPVTTALDDPTEVPAGSVACRKGCCALLDGHKGRCL